MAVVREEAKEEEHKDSNPVEAFQEALAQSDRSRDFK